MRFQGVAKATAGMVLGGALFLGLGAQTFTIITQQSGIRDIVAQKRASTTDWWNTGILFIDLDADGDLDFFISSHAGGGAVAALNDGHGVFSLASGSWPATEIHIPYDYNEDGKIDLTMTYQDGGGQWWRNNSTPGNLSFTTTGGSKGEARVQMMLDFNRDGKVDWLYGPSGTVMTADLANGAGFFGPGTMTLSGETFNMADLDGDGDLDRTYITGGGYGGAATSHVNRNTGNMQFSDITPGALSMSGMWIISLGDMDQDGDADIVALQNMAFPPKLFLNDGTGNFTEKAGSFTGSAGAAAHEGWGIGAVTDFDNDGIADYIVDGRNFLHVYRGTGAGNFQYANTIWHIKSEAPSAVDEGFAFGDMDQDGDLDLVGYGDGWPAETLVVYRNDLPAKNWVQVRPVGLTGNKGAAGSKIRIFKPGTDSLLWYEPVAIYGKQAQQPYYAYAQTERHFGLNTRSIVDVEVEFYPSGTKVRGRSLAANKTWIINENGTVGEMSTGVQKAEGKRLKAEEIQLEARPNPFKAQTIFSFSVVRSASCVELGIYDVRGRLVQAFPVLRNTHNASRTTSFTWNASAMPAGVYIARLQIGAKTLHKQIMLLK